MYIHVSVDGYDGTSSHHHKLMCSLLMTCCDISDTCKEWNTAKSIAVRIEPLVSCSLMFSPT